MIHAIGDLPARASVSAVFLIAMPGDAVLVVRNERGWDIPGGHVEPGETWIEALSREVFEEAAATFTDARPFAFLSTEGRADVMLFFVTAEFELHPFTPGEDAFERGVIPTELLLARYYGPKQVLGDLIRAAASAWR